MVLDGESLWNCHACSLSLNLLSSFLCNQRMRKYWKFFIPSIWCDLCVHMCFSFCLFAWLLTFGFGFWATFWLCFRHALDTIFRSLLPGNYMWFWGSSIGQPCERQAPYLLYYYSGSLRILIPYMDYNNVNSLFLFLWEENDNTQTKNMTIEWKFTWAPWTKDYWCFIWWPKWWN